MVVGRGRWPLGVQAPRMIHMHTEKWAIPSIVFPKGFGKIVGRRVAESFFVANSIHCWFGCVLAYVIFYTKYIILFTRSLLTQGAARVVVGVCKHDLRAWVPPGRASERKTLG